MLFRSDGVQLRLAEGAVVTAEYSDQIRMDQMRPAELLVPSGFPLERFAEAVFRGLGVLPWESRALARQFAANPSWLIDIPPKDVVNIQEVAFGKETVLVLGDRDNEGWLMFSPWRVTVIRSSGQRVYAVFANDRQLALRVIESLP